MAGLGIVLVLYGAMQIIFALSTGTIPERWPVEIRYREDSPQAYTFHSAIHAALAAAGILMIALA